MAERDEDLEKIGAHVEAKLPAGVFLIPLSYAAIFSGAQQRDTLALDVYADKQYYSQ